MLYLGMLLVGILVVVMAIAYFTVMLTIALVVGMFWVLVFLISAVTGEPYVGYIGAFVAMALIGFAWSYVDDHRAKPSDPS